MDLEGSYIADYICRLTNLSPRLPPSLPIPPLSLTSLARRVVASNRSLTNLDVQHNGFEQDVGVHALLDSFRHNCTLTMLNDKRLDIVKVQIWDLT